MATPKVLIKRSSVAGRVPSTGDLDYGELAINFEDGKIYYKDASNNIKAFVDSARVQAIADAVETTAEAQLDSAEVIALIDSAYVQARQADIYRDSGFVTSIIDGDYIVAIVDQVYIRDNQITYSTADFLDSDTVSLVVDSAYVQARQDFAYSSLTGAPNVLDSADVTNIVDSAYIALRTGVATDSSSTIALVTDTVDSAYVQARQLDSAANATEAINATNLNNQAASYYLNYSNLSNKPTILDTVDVSNIITTDVDKAFVDALNVDADTLDGYQAQYFIDKIDSNTARMLDSAEAIALIDSAYVQARQDYAYGSLTGVPTTVSTFTNDANYLDSTTVQGVIDSAYVRAKVRTDQDLRTTDSVTFAGLTVSGDLTITGTTTEINTIVYTINDPLLHLADSNEVSDVVDIGHIGHYYRDGQRRHTGIFRDASNEEYYIFHNMVDSAFDSTVPPNVINRSATDFTLSTVNVGTLVGVYAGFDSDFTAKSTSDLSEGTNLYYTTARHDSDTLAQVDSAYVQSRQTTYSNVSEFTNDANYLDSTTVQGVIDATYIQANQTTYNTSNFTDSAYVTGLPVSTFTNDANYLDSTTVQGVIDATYIQANQTTYNTADFTDSAYVTGLPVSTFTNDTNYLDSTTASALIDSAYITGKIADGQLIVDGDGSANGVIIQSGAITIRTDSSPAYVDFFCEVSNAHRTRVKSAAHADYSGNVDVTLPTTTGTIAITSDIPTLYTDYVDSAEVIKLITANAIDSSIALQLLLDSSEVVNLIDSAYINLRVDATNIDSIGAISNVETIAVTPSDGQALVWDSDNNYWKPGTVASGGGGGGSGTLDSAAAIQLIDSAYVQLRQSQVEGVTALEQTTYYFTASAGDSSFSGADDFSNTLSYTSGKVQVYINGILQVKTSDYVANNGTSVSLVEAADSGDIIAIETITGNTANTRLNLTTYVYTADSGDTTFAGADDRGLVLDYAEGRISVFLNGILLLDSDDYTATNGTSIVTNALDSGDVLTIQQFTGTNIGVDSSESRAIARTLVDSAYVQVRVPESYLSTIIDSAYVQLRQSAGGGGGTVDSASTINLINDRLITHNLGDVVGADGNPGDILISDGDGTATWSGNGALSYEFKVNYDSIDVMTITNLPTGWTTDSIGSTNITISHNTGRSVKDISYNAYVSGNLKLYPKDSADAVFSSVANRLNSFTAKLNRTTTGADASQYAWVNIIF